MSTVRAEGKLFDLSGRTAIVTGGGSGIGEAIALLLARQGAHVVIVDTNEAAGDSTRRDIVSSGGVATSLRCDVANADEVATVFASIARDLGRVHILVNNAGIAHIGRLDTTDEESFERLYQVNVRSVFLCSKAVAPAMAEQGGGVILNMASIAALIGLEDRFAYSMTKGAVLAMTRSIAADYMNRNVRCNCICPARVHTPFVDGFLAKSYPGREAEMFAKLSQAQPMGRMGTAHEVAVLALYLCSDESAFITGQALPLDGGVLVK